MLRLDGHAEVQATPGGERLGIARLEEDAADADYPFHANSFLTAGGCEWHIRASAYSASTLRARLRKCINPDRVEYILARPTKAVQVSGPS
jgi:hypothetical protein